MILSLYGAFIEFYRWIIYYIVDGGYRLGFE